MKKAESDASLERVSKVLGKEQTQEMTVMIAAKPIVQTEWFVIVFRYLAPVRTWRPWTTSVLLWHGSITKYLNESVVEQKHDGRGIPHPSPAVEEHLAKIADITNFGMAQAELPVAIQ